MRTLAGTEAILNLVFDDRAFLPFLKKLTRPDGSIPYFEMLLSSTVVNGNASKSEILSYRICP